MLYDPEEIKKDVMELRDIAEWMDRNLHSDSHYPSNGDFLRIIAEGIENITSRVERAVHVLTPKSEGGDAGHGYWDAVRARSILKGLGDPQNTDE